jgi:hypothetical protein
MREKAKMGVEEDLSQYDILYCLGCGLIGCRNMANKEE